MCEIRMSIPSNNNPLHLYIRTSQLLITANRPQGYAVSDSFGSTMCRCCFSSFRRLATGGGEESVVDSASIYSCRFRLPGIGVFSKGNESFL